MTNKLSLLYTFAVLCLGFLFTSCEETISPILPEDETSELQIGVDRIRTRALDDAFEKLDSIGIYAVKWENGVSTTLFNVGNYADNIRYTLWDEADNWLADEPIYFPIDAEKLDLYAYYPYDDSILIAGTTTVDLRIQPDQREYTNYTASDFVTADRKGVSRTAGKVHLTFDHKLSQLVFALKAGEGFTVEELSEATITIKNALVTATYDLSEGNEGIPVAGTERSDVLPTGRWMVSEGDESLIYGYKGIIVPQDLNQETYLEIALGSRVFVQKFSTPVTLESGESRLFTITIKNTGLDISTTLNPWNYGDPVEGEAEEPEKRDFDPKSLVAVYEVPDNSGIILHFTDVMGNEDFAYNCVVDWGDGTEPESVTEACSKSHTYSNAGVYYVTITGSADYVKFYSLPYLIAIEQWGDLGIKTWRQSMNDCSELTTIPTEMPPGDSFEYTFAHSGLKSIPAGLFSKCTSAISFKETFLNCKNLESIGEDAFANCINVESFERTFNQCVNLQAIPADLFKDCINVTSFLGIFQYCVKLEEIPKGLFDACTRVTDFFIAFHSCLSLTSLPVSLFDNNLNVTNFELTFGGCPSLTGITPNTNGIELWMRSAPEYTQYPDEINVSYCFSSCTNLDNYDDIPEGVK